MRLVIVTGLSGAGKSTALKMLEDARYFCVDNLPIPLVGKFVSLMSGSQEEDVQNAAIGIDARSGKALEELEVVLDKLKAEGHTFEILFLDAEDKVLVKRYKESRRSHPLALNGRVDDGIRQERQKTEFLRKRADYIIDTTHLLTRELKKELNNIFVDNGKFSNMMISVLSFGFKYGIPEDADLVFDVRFLPNPYYVDELRSLTGQDEGVFDYVMDNEIARQFAAKLDDMVKFLIPNYAKEGKTSLVIAIGCTGGKHRSVTLARVLYDRLIETREYGIRLEHRDIGKDALLKKESSTKGEWKLSFSGMVKEELSRQTSTARHCRIAETAALLSACGRITKDGSLRFQTENDAVVRKYFTLLQKTFNIDTEIAIRESSLLKKGNVYHIEITDPLQVQNVLQGTKLSVNEADRGTLFPENGLITQQNCCKRAFIRGAFLASGSISDPEKGYHFEIVCQDEAKAENLRDIIHTFQIDAKIVLRKKSYVVYVKEGAQIVDMLAIMEANVALMNLENIRILKEMRNSVNRKVNCETANINKTVSAAVKQIEDIRLIKEKTGLHNLNEGLAEIAELRLQYPEATLKELGMMLSPQVGKSGVNHRLRKLSEIADELRTNEEEVL